METMTAKQIRPFWGRVAIMESPVDETERPSGLIVPMRHEGQTDPLTRGVVLRVDQGYHDKGGEWADYVQLIDQGTVVYFRNGVKLEDIWIVDVSDILAYESDE